MYSVTIGLEKYINEMNTRKINYILEYLTPYRVYSLDINYRHMYLPRVYKQLTFIFDSFEERKNFIKNARKIFPRLIFYTTDKIHL